MLLLEERESCRCCREIETDCYCLQKNHGLLDVWFECGEERAVGADEEDVRLVVMLVLRRNMQLSPGASSSSTSIFLVPMSLVMFF